MALCASSSMAAQPLSSSHLHHHHNNNNLLLSSPFSLISRVSLSLSSNALRLSLPIKSKNRTFRSSSSSSVVVKASANSMIALIFDCDGVILESEDLHRQAYNDAFAFFNVRCPSDDEPLNWSVEFYDVLQNQIGGGKPKMRCFHVVSLIGQRSIARYFKEHGWPTSKIFEISPETDSDRSKLVDTLQDWKTERYQEIIKSGSVQPRPGVLRLMDEAKAAGKKLAVCSAATKSSVILTLESLIGLDRFKGLDCFLAGDDVKEKKPDPSIYLAAAKKLGVAGKDCLVVEDSVIGLQAATKAGMPCVITYTSSTSNQDFSDAIATFPDLSSVRLGDLEALQQNVVAAG